MKEISSKSVDLVVTSPPYPLIELWDDIFSTINPEIKEALENQNGPLTFELMHQELDKVWREVYRVLKMGGIACINVGDAVRTIGKDFRLHSNHSRILDCCFKLGFNSLPEIIWRKPTNAPNKFMGSGMLPPSAYVTLFQDAAMTQAEKILDKEQVFVSDEEIESKAARMALRAAEAYVASGGSFDAAMKAVTGEAVRSDSEQAVTEDPMAELRRYSQEYVDTAKES